MTSIGTGDAGEEGEEGGRLPFLSFAAEPPPGAISVSVERLIEDEAGWLFYGGPGSGKSHGVRQLVEETHGRIQQIIIDSEGEFWTLREAFTSPGFLWVAKDDGSGAGDVPLVPATAGVLCERIMRLGVSAIIDISGLRMEERPAYVGAFLEALLETPRAFWRPLLLVLDEVHRLAPQSAASASKSAVINVPAIGRKRGIAPIYATQTVEDVDTAAIGLLPNRLVGRMSQDNRRKRAADDFGLDAAGKTRLKQMIRGEFFAQGPAFGNETIRVRVPDTRTHKPPAGQAAHLAPTSAPDAIRELLAQFAALSEEAEGEAASLAEANRALEALRRENRKLRERPEAAAREVVRTVEKIVEVPVIGGEEIAGLRSLAEELTGTARRLIEEAGVIRQAISRYDRATAAAATTPAAPEESPEPEAAAPPAPPELASPTPTEETAPAPPPPVVQRPVAPAPEPPRPKSAASPALAALPVGQRKALLALARFYAVGVKSVSKKNVAAFSDQSPRSSTYDAHIKTLRDKGLIRATNGILSLTEAGVRLAGDVEPLRTCAELHTAWMRLLSEPQARVLRPLLLAYPKALSRTSLAERAGMSSLSSSFDARVVELKELGVVEYPQRGQVAATSLLFPRGLER